MSIVVYYAALRSLGASGSTPAPESKPENPSSSTSSDDKPKVSKNQAKNDKKKAKKAAAAEGKDPNSNNSSTAGGKKPAAAADKKPAGKKGQQQEEEVSASQYFQLRQTAIQNYTTKGNNPYPHKFNVESNIPQYIAKWQHLEKSQVATELVSVAGRIFKIRSSGAAIYFIDIQGDGEKIQVFATRDQFHNPDAFAEITTLLRRGDVIGIVGNPTRTKAGELSIIPRSELRLLAPCMHSIPFPDTLKSLETRFRNRYLDLIVNSQTRKTFLTRSRIISFLRRYFDERGFVEVETPMMDMKAGGAAAKPFKTYHNDLHTELYMRIAPELYLKQCIVGGIDKVYEIGRQFRNEGIDLTHYPEFTSMEFYWAYADYHDLMTLTEELLSTLVKTVTGGYVIKYNVPTTQEDGTVTIDTKTIDFTPPFKRVSIIEKLESLPQIGKLPKDLFSDEANQFLINKIKELKIDMKPPFSTMRLIDKLVGEYIEVDCLHPTFLIDHPQVMSPLAKGHREKEGMTERFELFVNERELCNAYTELNDPRVQRERFEAQMRDKVKLKDEEAQESDEVFIHALEIGLPPTAGWGMGIDRLAMLLTDSHNIKEVLLFPAMKDGSGDVEEEKKEEKK